MAIPQDRMNRVVAPIRSAYPIGCRDLPDAPATTVHQAVTFVDGMALKCGVSLQRLDIAHRTYGTLNAALPWVRPDGRSFDWQIGGDPGQRQAMRLGATPGAEQDHDGNASGDGTLKQRLQVQGVFGTINPPYSRNSEIAMASTAITVITTPPRMSSAQATPRKR